MANVTPNGAKLSFGRATNAGICIKESGKNLILKTIQANKEFKA